MKNTSWYNICMKNILYISILAVVFTYTTSVSATCYNVNYNAKFGMRDTSVSNNVSVLQLFLREFNFLAPGPSGYFGPSTLAAVKTFQARYGIQPVAGFVGSLTRAKIKEVSCSGNTNPIYNPPTGNANTVQYGQNSLSTHTLYNGENIIYRYKIKAPDNTSTTISDQNFTYTQSGIQTSGLKLEYSFDDYFGSSLLGSTFITDSSLNTSGYISKNLQFTLSSPLTIPAGRTLYVRVVQQVVSRNYGGSISIAHSRLGTERLTGDSASATPSVVITSQNTGETLTKNNSYTIRWSSTQLGNNKTLSLALVHTDGTVYSIGNVYGSDSGYGEYQWTIPSTIQARSGYRIRITSGTVSDVSDMTFTIQEPTPTVTVTSPASGDIWNLDSTTSRTISWTYAGLASTRIATVYLLFPDNTQCTLATTTLGQNSVSGSIRTNSCLGVVKTITPGSYKIGVGAVTPTGVPVLDYMDASFTITSNAVDPSLMVVTSPNGGNNLIATQSSTITWTTPSSISTTDLVSLSLDVYSSSGSSPYKTVPIATNIRNAKTYTWAVPATLSGIPYVASDRYKVTVIAQENTSLRDSSNDFFSINPLQRVVNLTAPTQTTIARDTDFTVSWNKSGFLDTDKLHVAITPVGGSTNTVIKSNVLVSDGSTTVKIPLTTALNSYRITLVPVSYAFGSGSTVTSNLFALTNKTGYSITPGTIGSQAKGDYVTTTWTTAGLTGANLSIRLLTAAGTPIAGVGAVSVSKSAGEKDILIPATLSDGQYKISYEGMSDGTTVTVYSNTFTVAEPAYAFSLIPQSSATRGTNTTVAWSGTRLRSGDTIALLIKDPVGNTVTKTSTFGAGSVSVAIPTSFASGTATIYATTTGVGYTRAALGAQQSLTVVDPVLPSITINGPSANSTSTGSITGSWTNNNFGSAASTITSLRVSLIQKKGATTNTSVIESGMSPSSTGIFIPIAPSGTLGSLRNVGIDLTFEYQLKVEALAGSTVVTSGTTVGTFRIQK